ncbi:MAG: DUF3078 domain-containing protein [Paludibacteraceae bacterium]|nr:DUF3078 domain-containing protein [Paludibacteraceae bacterium]
MKTKYNLLAAVAVMGVSTLAAQDEVNEGLKTIKETQSTVSELAESHKGDIDGDLAADSAVWKFPGIVGMNAAQTFHNVYSHDGTGSTFAIDGYLNLNANYTRARHKWDNSFSAKYGINLSSEYEHNPKVHKAIDELNLSTKYGFKATKNLFYSAMASFESRFTPTYNYKNVDAWFVDRVDDIKANGGLEANETPIGHVNNMFDELDRDSIKSLGMMQNKFGNPNIVKVSLGMDYVPSKLKGDMSIYVSPITGKFTFCKDDDIAPNYSMKRDVDGTYMDMRTEVGALLTVNYTKSFNKVFTLISKLEGFFAYNKETYGFSEDFKNAHPQFNKGMVWTGYDIVDLNDYVDEIIASTKSLQFDNNGKMQDIYDKSNGWSVKYNLDLLFKLTKHIDLSIKTQLKYDKAEINYHREIQQADEDILNKHASVRDPKFFSLVDEDVRKYNYGYRKAYLQFWESTTLGLSYSW